MATAESVKAKIQNLIATANEATGNADADLTAAVNSLIAGFGTGGGAKVTEYVVTEDADRSLWLNEQSIKLVKGVNLFVSSKLRAGGTNKQGAITLMFMFWNGNSFKGWHCSQSNYSIINSAVGFVIGNTSKITVAEDGTLFCTTSATGVTTGNYNNSYIEGGYTYYLFQAESEVVC